jgi:cell division protein FtsB
VQDRPRRPQFKSKTEGSKANVTSAVGMEETVGHLRTRQNSLFARTVIWITGLICVAFLIGTFIQAWSNSQLTQKVQAASLVLKSMQEKHQILEQQTKYYGDPAVIENEARQQMGYVRPSEQAVVIINQDDNKQPPAQPKKDVAQPQNYWQEWWHIFFG